MLLVLTAMDDRIRMEITVRLKTPAASVAATSARATSFVRLAQDVARDQAVTHTPLLLLAFAGIMVVLITIRT